MFFSFLFKGKKGDSEKVERSLFNTAVVANIVGLSLACLALLLGAYRNFEDFYKYAGTAIILIIITYLLVLTLAALSSINKEKNTIVAKQVKEEVKKETSKNTKKVASTKKNIAKKVQR